MPAYASDPPGQGRLLERLDGGAPESAVQHQKRLLMVLLLPDEALDDAFDVGVVVERRISR